jgi:hypothetical protein
MCDTRERPHLQCLNPPRAVVPDGSWHYHLCDEVLSNVAEFSRVDNPILFSRLRDQYRARHASLLTAYVHRQQAALAELEI